MRLTKITVHGLFGEYDYEIPLKKGLTFIHSPNGMGKSTVMKLVQDAISGNADGMGPVPFERLTMDFDDGSRLIALNRNGEVKVQMSRNGLEEDVAPGDLEDAVTCVYLPPERVYITDADGNLTSALHTYMNDLSRAIKEAKADSVLKITPSDGKMSEGDIDRSIKDSMAKMDFMRQAGLDPVFPKGCHVPPSRYEISQDPATYGGLALSMSAWCDRYYGFAESVVVFKDVVNSVFVNKTVYFNEMGFPEAKMDRSGVMVPLEKFSSGERQILIILYTLLFRCRPGSLAIIDEPEVSLHVSWQQQLGKIFGDIARIRDLTVIVATHAPAVIHDGWDSAVELCNTRE